MGVRFGVESPLRGVAQPLALGAEVFAGNLLDFGSGQREVERVPSTHFAYPVQDGLLDAIAAMAVVMRAACVSPGIINLVMLRSSPDAPTPGSSHSFRHGRWEPHFRSYRLRPTRERNPRR